MLLFFVRIRFWVIPVLLLSLAGCSDTQESYVVRTDAQGNTRIIGSDTAVLASNVRQLSESAAFTIVEVTENSVTFEGTPPDFGVGDVLLKADGSLQLTRRVVSIRREGGRVVVGTAPVGLESVFREADIQETILLGPEFLSSLQSDVPGITFGEPVQVLAQGTEVFSWRLPVNFKEAIVSSNSRGSVTVDGDAGLTVSLRTELKVGSGGVERFALVPHFELDGNLTVTGAGSGDFRTQIPICPEFSYPLIGFLGIGLNLEGTFLITVDGYVQTDGSLAMKGGVVFEAGVEATNNQFRTVHDFRPTFEVTPPSFIAEASLLVSLIQPKVSVNLADLGEVSINASLLQLDVDARAVGKDFNVRVFRTWGLEAGARLALGLEPFIYKYEDTFPLVSGERVKMVEVGVPIADEGSGGIVNVTLLGSDQPMRVGEERLLLSIGFTTGGNSGVYDTLRWSSTNPQAVEVRSLGWVAFLKAVGPGEADIVATPSRGRRARHRQVVSGDGFASIEFLKEGKVLARALPESSGVRSQSVVTATVPERRSAQLQAFGVYPDGGRVDLNYSLQWSATGTRTQTFRNGQVDGRFAGTSTVTVTDPISGRESSLNIEVVREPIRSLAITPLTPQKINVSSGQTRQLGADARFSYSGKGPVTRFVEWETSDPEIATVSNGLVRGVSPGEVTIVARDPDGSAFAQRRVVVDQAPLVAVRVEPSTVSDPQVGQTQQFRAIATFADGSEKDVTDKARWSVTVDAVATVTPTGLVSYTGAGTSAVKAFYQSLTGSTPLPSVNGPAGLRFVSHPPDVNTGQSFQVTVEVRDTRDQLWTFPVPVTLELAPGSPANAQLSGVLTRTTSGGTVTFTGLAVNQVGTGYRLQAVGNRLTIAGSEEFVADNPAVVVGHVFVSNQGRPGGTGGLSVFAVEDQGEMVEIPESPYDTANTASSSVKSGNFVYVANSGSGPGSNSITGFRVDPNNGTLTQVYQSADDAFGTLDNELYRLAAGGGDLLAILSVREGFLTLQRVASNGTLSDLDFVDLGTDFYNGVHYHDVAGSSTDLLFVSSQFDNKVHAFLLDTVTGTLTEAGGSPFDNATGLAITAGMTTVGSNLFLVNFGFVPPGVSGFSQFTINEATGELSAAQSRTLDTPTGMFAVGSYLLVAHNRPTPGIAVYLVSGSALTEVAGSSFALSEQEGRSFVNVNLGSGTVQGLYVTTSNQLDGFLFDTTSGAMSRLGQAPYTSVSSPVTVTH